MPEDIKREDKDAFTDHIEGILLAEIKIMLEEGYTMTDVPDMIQTVMTEIGHCPSFDFLSDVFRKIYTHANEKKIEAITGDFLFKVLSTRKYKKSRSDHQMAIMEQKYMSSS